MRLSFWLVLLSVCAAAQTRTLTSQQLRDKIAGGWAGQMIGVSFGAPTEFRYKEQIIPRDKLPAWRPDRVSNSINQDDLYVDMTFAKVLDDKGLDATTADFGAMFRDAKYRLWHANLAARRALKRGVPADLSGTPKYNSHANDIDFQIEADFAGLMAPGLPGSATEIAWRAGRVMNYGDGIYGGIFVSCMYAAAFFESDPHKVVGAGGKCLPAKAPYARLVADLIAWHKESPQDWESVWAKLEKKWNRCEACPSGALNPFNIDASLNGAYIALGLLYGDGSMGMTLEVSTRAGQDSDCNPASAAGILGVMLGYERIPSEWKSGIAAIEDKKFSYTDFTFKTIVDSTYNRAVALVKKTGGKAEGDTISVRTQPYRATKYEVWDDYGCPRERIPISDARFRFSGAWDNLKTGTGKTASAKGAEAAVDFEGTGFILTGPYLPNGGTADVYLDGKPEGQVDVFSDEDVAKGGDSVYHRFGLKPGKHSVRLVVRGAPYPGSKGSDITLVDLVVFR